jgi:hypothetical protein
MIISLFSDFFQLYFDLEFKIDGINEQVDGETMMREFKQFLQDDLKASVMNNLGRIEMIDLDSTTKDKFSRHLIVNLYDDEDDDNEPAMIMFVNNIEVGRYVRHLCDKIKFSRVSKLILPNNKLFVDEAVYSKNRNFRTYLSSKFGKTAVLKKIKTTIEDGLQNSDGIHVKKISSSGATEAQEDFFLMVLIY